MPTQTFNNLPEEKREKIVTAIQAEFARVPFPEVSINQIVKQAGISRGSFYQYFRNKDDLLHYLLSEYQCSIISHMKTSLEQNGGDLFEMLLDMFDFTYSYINEDSRQGVFRNVFSDIRLSIALLEKQVESDPSNEFLASLAPLVNVDLLDTRSERDIHDMLGILLPMTAEAYARALLDDAGHEQARRDYEAKLALLKRGFSKDKS